MSWFSTNKASEFEGKIAEATSESIPNGELDIAVSLEITDIIRSKAIEPKTAMRCLKKRLTSNSKNPNVQLSTLKLIDTCVKNSGFQFCVEVASKEMITTLTILLNRNDTNPLVASLILQLLQEWSVAFKGQLQLGLVEKTCAELRADGYEFPPLQAVFNEGFINSETAPDWIDDNVCMICSDPFTFVNRKHHCRSCGGVFCQEHSAHNMALIDVGINEPVRVCDGCYEKRNRKRGKSGGSGKGKPSRREPVESDDEELRRAIELSLRESGTEYEPEPVCEDEDDADMKAAIAASLRVYEEQSQPKGLYNAYVPTETALYQTNNHPESFQPSTFQSQTVQEPSYATLSQEEEDSITLFSSLVENLANGPPDAVIKDRNLQTLHTQVAVLKPKSSRALNDAIAKYEMFLELNNKLHTISRLYDQLLEQKLARAYENHRVSSQPLQYQPTQSYSYPQGLSQTLHVPTQIYPQATGEGAQALRIPSAPPFYHPVNAALPTAPIFADDAPIQDENVTEAPVYSPPPVPSAPAPSVPFASAPAPNVPFKSAPVASAPVPSSSVANSPVASARLPSFPTVPSLPAMPELPSYGYPEEEPVRKEEPSLIEL